MTTPSDLITESIRSLKVSPAVQRGLGEFVAQVMDLYARDLISITAFGSAVTGDYDDRESDVNLLIVYSDLNIVDLERVSDLSRRWLRKYRFAPRFLSQRNLEQSARYFQVDFLLMRDAHAVLWGADVLAGMGMRPAELRWQIAYEIKAMRMRVKQQFWRVSDDPPRMRAVLIERFNSLTHLLRALLLLVGQPAPAARRALLDAAIPYFGLGRAWADRMVQLRQSSSPPNRAALIALFTGLMDWIRILDARVEEVTV